MFARVRELVRAREEQRVVGNVDDAFEIGHFRGIDGRGDDIANEKQLGVAVVHDVVNLVGREFVENRHGDGSVGERGEVGGGPVRAVATAKGDFVAFDHAAVLEHDVEFLDFPSHIVVLQRRAFIVGQCITIPMLDDAFFYQFVDTWDRRHSRDNLHFKCHSCKRRGDNQ